MRFLYSTLFCVCLLFGLTGISYASQYVEKWNGNDYWDEGNAAEFYWDFEHSARGDRTNTDMNLTSDVAMPDIDFQGYARIEITLSSIDRQYERADFSLNIWWDGHGTFDIGNSGSFQNFGNEYIFTYILSPHLVSHAQDTLHGTIYVDATDTNSNSRRSRRNNNNDFNIIEVAMTVGMDDGTFSPVPEPGTMILFGIGLIGLARFGRQQI